VADTLKRLWTDTKWENASKEASWRLSVDGITLLGNSHVRYAAAAWRGCGVQVKAF
jgi:hypothetical protein